MSKTLSNDDYKFLVERGIDYVKSKKDSVSFESCLECFLSLQFGDAQKYAVGMVLLANIDKMRSDNKIPKEICKKLTDKIMEDL